MDSVRLRFLYVVTPRSVHWIAMAGMGRRLGKGGRTFFKSLSLPSPNPIPPASKYFDLIESLTEGVRVVWDTWGSGLLEKREKDFWEEVREPLVRVCEMGKAGNRRTSSFAGKDRRPSKPFLSFSRAVGGQRRPNRQDALPVPIWTHMKILGGRGEEFEEGRGNLCLERFPLPSSMPFPAVTASVPCPRATDGAGDRPSARGGRRWRGCRPDARPRGARRPWRAPRRRGRPFRSAGRG